MAETIERAKADDPKELRKRIAELERQLRETTFSGATHGSHHVRICTLCGITRHPSRRS
jgi:hypothetical protein